MLLGRYVYTAQQIVSRVVYKRDALDGLIRGISSIDLRVAWIGWILSVLVWAVRALIQTLFSLVSIFEKALSREMEFHADLVAVSVTGSDALIHSLYKLRAADEAYNASVGFLDSQLQKIRAGKANPTMLSSVMVEAYGIQSPMGKSAQAFLPANSASFPSPLWQVAVRSLIIVAYVTNSHAYPASCKYG